VTDTIEGLLRVESEGMTLQPCDRGGPAWVIEDAGADLRGAAAGFGVRGGTPLLARVIGEFVTPPDTGPGAGRGSAIRVVRWVYLAEDTSGCVPGREGNSESTSGGVEDRPASDELILAAARAGQIRSGLSEARRLEGQLVRGDASSTFTAYLGSSNEVVWLHERLDLGDYGSREVEYALSGGTLFYIRETGQLRDLSVAGNGALVPREFEVAIDADGSILKARMVGPGFEAGSDAAVQGARSHLEELLAQIRPRVDGSGPGR
jgi:hypothetical protein